jgi:hypothetical protein
MLIALGVLAELGVPGPVPLVFDGPTLPHRAQQSLGADAQSGDNEVDVVKRLAVTPTGAHQLDDPAGTSPALPDGVCGIAGTERPPDLAAMAGLEMADHDREVPVSAELGHDLLNQTALVLFDRQEQVGALLGGELNNAGEVGSASAWINTPSSSSVLRTIFSGVTWVTKRVAPAAPSEVESQGALGSSRSSAAPNA